MKHWLPALLMAALVPYGIICLYALPFGDDFCFGWTAAENISFLQKFLNQYLYWNGRYTSDILINLHPILTGKLWVLQGVLLASLLATPIVWYLLCNEVIGEKRTALIVSLFITLFYLCYMPQLTEGIYWYGGIVNYHIGNLVLLLHVVVMLRVTVRSCHAELVSASPTGAEIPKQVRDDKYVPWPLAAVPLLIVSTGFNEVAALLLPAVYLALTLYSLRARHYMHRRFFWLLVVAVIAACLVVFAPGNVVRASQFNGQHNLFTSLFYALLQTGRFIALWLFNYPALALLLLTSIYAEEWKAKLRLQLNGWVTLALALFVLFLSAFVPYYATGMLGQHRTINYAFFFVMPLLALSVLQLAAQYGVSGKLAVLRNNKLRSFLAVTAVIACMFTGNGLLIIKDFTHGKFHTYKSEFEEREMAVKKGVEPYPLKTLPATFRITDVADSTAWVGTCMENYYHTER
jgi:hypothetical protein